MAKPVVCAAVLVHEGGAFVSTSPSSSSSLVSVVTPNAALAADAVPLPSALAGRGMPQKFGFLLQILLSKFVDHIVYPKDMAEKLAKLATTGVDGSPAGTLVYVNRARNPVDYLALSSALRQNNLPRARFVGGLNVKPYHPWWGMFYRRRPKGAPDDPFLQEEWLIEECVRNGHAAQLFLERPLTLLTTESSYRARYMEALIRAQRASDKPIYLVPHFLALRPTPSALSPTAADVVFGSSESPGLLRAFVRLALAFGKARWEVSEPVNLLDFIQQQHRSNPEISDAALAKKVRWLLLNHLGRAERVVHGPPLKSYTRMQEETLRDVQLQKQIKTVSTDTNTSIEVVENKARTLYQEIAARFDIDVVRLFDVVLKLVFSRIYDGISVDHKDMDKVRRAARHGPLVLVPSHRSHIDYLVMSQVMLQNDLLPPHIAAGVNLSFFPLGPIFRRSGAYFIRRSFKGEALYPSVFRAYVKRLFKEQYPQEFFIEGGRSRTGKTLPPKLGVLSMLVEAFLEGREQDAIFMPASIAYEKIIESRSYTKELGGAEKEKESAAGLIKSAGVLVNKYGKVFVTFEEAISLDEMVKAFALSRNLQEHVDIHRPEEVRTHILHNTELLRSLVQQLGLRIVYNINRATVVTATALVVTSLLGWRKRSLDEKLLLITVKLLLQHIDGKSTDESPARFAPYLRDDVDGQIHAELQRMVKDKNVRIEEAGGRKFYKVEERAYLPLDYYKNNILHYFVPEAIVSTALKANGARVGSIHDLDTVAAFAKQISRILKYEFIFRPGDTFETLYQEALDNSVASGLLLLEEPETGAKRVQVPDDPQRADRLIFTANLIANFVEAYWSALRNIKTCLADPKSKKDLYTALLDAAKADFISGDMRCPEAVHKAWLENAVELMLERNIILAQPIPAATGGKESGKSSKDGKLMVTTESAPLAELAQMIDVLERARR